MKAILRLGAGALIGLVLIFALLVTAVATLPARAQELKMGQCLSYPVLIEQLADRFGEKVFFYGETAVDSIKFQIAASPKGTWTVFFVDAEKDSACVLFFGAAWTGEDLPAQSEEL